MSLDRWDRRCPTSWHDHSPFQTLVLLMSSFCATFSSRSEILRRDDKLSLVDRMIKPDATDPKTSSTPLAASLARPYLTMLCLALTVFDLIAFA